MLRFITCGSVDDGKSTLIGKLLWESKQLFTDQLSTLVQESKKYGTQGDNIDFALLVDGLSAEREQGITIDVAYRFFSTPKRKFIVADTPGHEQYTRNMVTGASTADVAIILVDIRKGILTQTKRHAFLASTMQINHIILAINKMDLIDYDFDTFEKIKNDFLEFAQALNFKTTYTIPISALKGDNVLTNSEKTGWYSGQPLLDYLETIPIATVTQNNFVFPIQFVNRPNSDFRGFSGTVSDGQVEVGDKVRVAHSGQHAKITEIVTMDGLLPIASKGSSITLRLDTEIDASRGDVFTSPQNPLELSDQFQATIVWMHEDEGLLGRSYDLKLATQWCTARVSKILYRINVNTLEHEPTDLLKLNDIVVCNLHLNKKISSTVYKNSKILGNFILVDKYTNATVAAGMISHNLRRSQNIHKQSMSVTHEDRELLNGHQSKVLWFTGLSGSGKSTIANLLEQELHKQGKHTYILDGDNIRLALNHDLGFSEVDRIENIRRISEVAKLMMDAGLIVIVTTISPFMQDRQMARNLIGEQNFLEIYIDTPIAVCKARDPKGLYKKAKDGLIPNMTGINSPYEVPESANIIIKGHDEKNTSKHVENILDLVINSSNAFSMPAERPSYSMNENQCTITS